jgi:DNA-binding GntR family transcriptional regulator
MAGVTRKPAAVERPEDLQDFASRQIVQAIMKGELKPGDRLSPMKLAEEFQISHIPVRESLARLESSGHVVRTPRIGFFVAELSLEYIEDVYHWRQVLEDEAHRMAIPKLDAADFAEMRKLNQASSRAPRYSDRYIDLNREFHYIAFRKAGSETLLRFLNHLWDASQRYQARMSSSAVSRTLLREQHAGLIEAFEARDVKAVNAHMAEHRGLTLAALRDMLAGVEVELDA